MGTFLSLTSVIGKTEVEVVASLKDYAKSVGGGLEQENLSFKNDNFCVIQESNGNTTIFNPDDYLEWDNSSEFISRALNTAVFSFHIHDGDLWMYILFVNGEIVDQFNPVPDYWADDLSEEEIQSWKGDAATVVKYVDFVKKADIANYLVRWDLEADDSQKAYSDDKFGQEDWQLIDFMNKLRLPYPIDNSGNPDGQIYKLWTNRLKLTDQQAKTDGTKTGRSNKPWWKFW